jgi:hypothetical protein
VKAFVLTPRGFKDLVFPGSEETVARGLNAAGQVVGYYFEGTEEEGVFHSYVWNPWD